MLKLEMQQAAPIETGEFYQYSTCQIDRCKALNITTKGAEITKITTHTLINCDSVIALAQSMRCDIERFRWI